MSLPTCKKKNFKAPVVDILQAKPLITFCTPLILSRERGLPLVFKCTEEIKKNFHTNTLLSVIWIRKFFFPEILIFSVLCLTFTIPKGSNQNIKVFTHAHSSRMTLFKLSPSVLPAFITETICGIFKNSPPAIIVILKMLQNICNPYDRVILIITLINCGLNKYYIIYVTNC